MNGPLSVLSQWRRPKQDDLDVIPSDVDRRNFPSFSRETASETESAMKIGAIGSF
jgi:hypothetical protein